MKPMAALVLLCATGCMCGPQEATPPGGQTFVSEGTTTRDGGRADAGRSDAGSNALDGGDDAGAGDGGLCACSSGAGPMACGEQRCEGGLQFTCDDLGGLRIEESRCADAGRPPQCGDLDCRCDIVFSPLVTINVPCCIYLCSGIRGSTCYADGGQAEVSCR